MLTKENTKPSTATPLRILQITDPHLFKNRGQRLLNIDTDASLSGVVAHIRAQAKPIDLVLVTGDISQDGSPESYQRCLELASSLGAPVYGLPGNHDQLPVLESTWGQHLEPVIDTAFWRLVLLDSTLAGSNGGHLADSQLQLLEDAIRQAEQPHVLVALHHNPVPVGSTWLDTMRVDNGAQLMDLLNQHPAVKGVLWGHVHQAFDALSHRAEAKHGGPNHPLHLMATPSTCVQFKPGSDKFALDFIDPGYRELLLHTDGQIDTHVIRVSGLGLQPDSSSRGY